jgi:hypothetical protein
MIDNVLYISTPYNRVVALDAESGRELWAYGASRHVGLRSAVAAQPRVDQARRAAAGRRRPAHEAGPGVRLQSADGEAGVADRRAARARERHAGRTGVADAADADKAAGARGAGLVRGRRVRPDAGASRRGADRASEAAPRADLYAAVRARHAAASRHHRRRELGRGRVRSGVGPAVRQDVEPGARRAAG